LPRDGDPDPDPEEAGFPPAVFPPVETTLLPVEFPEEAGVPVADLGWPDL
jgi:hypothetical protein